MDFELDTVKGILHVKSEAFDAFGFTLSLFNEYFFEYLREFFIGKHLKSMAEFINNWNNLKDEFEVFMNLRFLGYMLSTVKD